MQSSKKKLQITKHGVWKVECEMQIIEHETWVSKYEVLQYNVNAKHKQQSKKWLARWEAQITNKL
jgi:hypothetical protein